MWTGPIRSVTKSFHRKVIFFPYLCLLIYMYIYISSFNTQILISGENSHGDGIQGVFLSLKNAKNGAFLKTPFYPYVRPAENQQIFVTTLVKYNGGRRNRVTNKAEIRRTLTNLRFLLPELEEIFRESIPTLPENRAILEKWIETAAAVSGKVRKLRRALFFNRAIDIKNARKIVADINKKIHIVRKSVGMLKHRVSLKAATSPLITMIEDFQLDFPDYVYLKFGGESTKQRLLGVKIHLRCNLCIKKLCLENIVAVISHLDGHGKVSQPFSRTKFYVSGRAPKVLSLSPGKILSLPKRQSINMIFNRDSEDVSIEFGALIRLFGLSQFANATLDKAQLSVNVKGKIFAKFPSELDVVAKIRESENWNSLLFLVKGKMLKSSLLPNKLQNAINNYTLALAQNAQRRIQRAEAATNNAKRQTKEAETILKKKKIASNNASKILDDKVNNLVQKRIVYAQRKIRFNSTLLSYLHLKNQTLCEMKACKNDDIKTCIPDVCQKKVKTKVKVRHCREFTDEITVARIKKVKKRECFTYNTPTKYTKTGGGWWSDEGLEQKGNVTERECVDFFTLKKVTEKQKVKKFKCTEKEVEISDLDFPYECCSDETIQVLNSACVKHNSDCWRNITDIAQQLKLLRNNESALFADFQLMTEMGRQVNVAQMEVNLARTRDRLASNQVELARALLQQHRYAEQSMSINKIKEQEQLGIRLANKLKRLDVNEMVTVESLSFSTSMTSSTKSLLPFVASVKDVDGNDKFVEFPIEFKKIDYSLASASKLIIQMLFGKLNSRQKRSTHDEFLGDKLGMDNGQSMCFFSHQANALFTDIINSLEFLVERTDAYFQAISSGIEEVDSLVMHSAKKSFSPTLEPQKSFSEMMQSLKDNYIDITSTTTWETILENWRVHLNVLTGGRNFTKCSGTEDCLEYFFRNLDEFYLFEYSHRALEIKQNLHEMKMVFNSLLQRNSSFTKVKEIVPIAKALLNKTKDDSVLCGTSPVIVKSSPAEFVVLIGGTVNLTCLVANSSEVEIVWIKNERVIEDMNDEVLVLRNATTQTEGAYKCAVSNNRGVTASNVSFVMVHKAPSITNHPRDVRVLVGTETLLMTCSSDGVPRPTTEWFFKPRSGKVVRLNSSNRMLIKKNLTSQDSGFYYCNVSNIHGTITSRMARLDVLEFTAGRPRIVVNLKFARCAIADFPDNDSNCTDHHYTSALQLDYAGVHNFFTEITAKMRWAWNQIERLDFSLHTNVSLSFVITSNGSDTSKRTSSDLFDTLNSISLSRYKLARDLRSFRAALLERKFIFLKKNALIVPRMGGFAARLITQKCPEGKQADENGLSLCGGYFLPFRIYKVPFKLGVKRHVVKSSSEKDVTHL